MTCALQGSVASSLRPRANPRGFSALPNQIQAKNKTGQSPALFLAEGEGFAPLAVRPGAQPTGLVQFALQLSEIDLDAQTARSRSRLHPRIPHQTKFKPKIKQGKALLYFWRKVRDSHLWRCAPVHSPPGWCSLRSSFLKLTSMRKPLARARVSTLESLTKPNSNKK